MALLPNTSPIKLSQVKSAYGSGSNNLRGYLPGAGITTHVVTPDGFIPSSGTLKLSDFLGGTSINVGSTAANASINITVNYRDYTGFGGEAYCTLRFFANTGPTFREAGCLQLIIDGVGTLLSADNPWTSNTATGSGGVNIANLWLMGANTDSSTNDFDPAIFSQVDFLWNPTLRVINTNGLAQYSSQPAGATANTWVNANGKYFTIDVGALSPSVGADTTDYEGWLAIRMNASPQTVLSNTFINIRCLSRTDP